MHELGEFIGFIFKNNKLQDFAFEKKWEGYNLIDSKDSIYGNVTLLKNQENNQNIFFENGLHLFTVPDLLTAEETAHFSFLQFQILLHLHLLQSPSLVHARLWGEF